MIKIPKLLQHPTDLLQQGDIVTLYFGGRGCRPGIVLTPSKRKSCIRFIDGKEEWTENNKLYMIDDYQFKIQVLRWLK